MLPGPCDRVSAGAKYVRRVPRGQSEAEIPPAGVVDIKQPSRSVGSPVPVRVQAGDRANPCGIARRNGIRLGPEFDGKGETAAKRSIEWHIYPRTQMGDGHPGVIQPDRVSHDT